MSWLSWNGRLRLTEKMPDQFYELDTRLAARGCLRLAASNNPASQLSDLPAAQAQTLTLSNL